MKKFLSFVLAVAICAPVFAQRGPKLEQSIAIGDVKMSLNYTSINWGEGKTLGTLMSKEGAEMREAMNTRMAARPGATFTTSVECKCGDVTLAAGEHKVYFTIGDDLVWSLNFKTGEKVQTVKLTLADSGHESKQLLMCLYAADGGGAGVYLAFGKMSGDIKFAPSAPKTEGK